MEEKHAEVEIKVSADYFMVAFVSAITTVLFHIVVEIIKVIMG